MQDSTAIRLREGARLLWAPEHRRDARRRNVARAYKPPPGIPSRAALAELVPEAVYFLRTADDLIKIGWTQNIARRSAELGGWHRLLAITPGTYEHEQVFHRGLREHCARGREFYWPVDPVFEHIDRIRTSMEFAPVTRWSVPH